MKKNNLLLIGLLVVLVVGGLVISKGKKPSDGLTSPIPRANGGTVNPQPTKVVLPTTLGGFMVTNKEICLENGKPVVYFFGSTTCPHCVWEKPVIEPVMAKFKDAIVFKERINSQDDMAVFNQYKDINPGYIPFVLLGCKYARVGSGESGAATKDEAVKLEGDNLTAIVCKLTGGKPESVCGPLAEKTKEVL